MSKIFETLLEDFKKANTAARERLAAKFGYSSPEKYETDLRSMIVGTTEPAISVKKTRKRPSKKAQVLERVTVHNVHILDASGSMDSPYNAPKIKAAIEGINMEMEDMKKDTSTEVTQTIIHFSDPMDIQEYCWKSPLGKVKPFNTGARGSTALLETVGNTLTKLLTEANGKDKVLVKIFTDGRENSTSLDSPWKNPKAVSDLIKRCEEKGFTITFVGTEEDVKYVVNLLSIDASNTLSHKNTAESIGQTYAAYSAATAKFRTSASRGEDVVRGFFTKETGTL